MVAFMRDRGAWAEAVSDAEYELALALGYMPQRVVLNGPYKSRDRLRSALLGGSIINLAAKRDIEWTIELARNAGPRIRCWTARELGSRDSVPRRKYFW